jgi:hypothetical protein
MEAADEDDNILFAIQREDLSVCTIEVVNPLFLNKGNLEEVLTAVRRAVHELGLEG